MKKILFIDDEANILKSLKRIFRNLEFDCYYAENIKDAVKILMEVDFIDMLVSDIKMPGFDGIRVLKLFKEASPQTIRVALSGYASVDSITEAVSKNLAKQYFYKPWDNEILIESIRKMFKLEDEFKQLDIFENVQKFDSIKTLPKLYDRICDAILKDLSIEEICKIIEEDPAITSNLLRLANSAFYQAKTGSLDKAVMYIGLNNLKQIILSYELSQVKDIMVKSGDEVWKHSSRTNNIFHDLHELYYKKRVPPLIGTAGLIHDIGKIIMFQMFEMEYANEILSKNLSHQEIIKKERELFNMDHSLIGGFFLNWWAFPVELVEVCIYHHNPMTEGVINKELVALVCLASSIERGEMDILRHYVLDAMDVLKIDLKFLNPIIEKYS